jgi:hypothetical protein
MNLRRRVNSDVGRRCPMNLTPIETPELFKLMGYFDAVADFIRGDGQLKWYFDFKLFDCEGTFSDVQSLIKHVYPTSKPELADIHEGRISDVVASLKHEFSKWLTPPEVATLLQPVTDMRTELWQHLKACVDYENARVFEYYTQESMDGFGHPGLTAQYAAVILNETQKRCLMLSSGDCD